MKGQRDHEFHAEVGDYDAGDTPKDREYDALRE
jgi:hypothetical protein